MITAPAPWPNPSHAALKQTAPFSTAGNPGRAKDHMPLSDHPVLHNTLVWEMLVKNPISINTEKAANKSLWIQSDGNLMARDQNWFSQVCIKAGTFQQPMAGEGHGHHPSSHPPIAQIVLLWKMSFLSQKALTTTEWPVPSKTGSTKIP